MYRSPLREEESKENTPLGISLPNDKGGNWVVKHFLNLARPVGRTLSYASQSQKSNTTRALCKDRSTNKIIIKDESSFLFSMARARCFRHEVAKNVRANIPWSSLEATAKSASRVIECIQAPQCQVLHTENEPILLGGCWVCSDNFASDSTPSIRLHPTVHAEIFRLSYTLSVFFSMLELS